MAIKLGITGGIGSGKSVVSRLLVAMGIPVYISDVESKQLAVSDPTIRAELISLLGEEVYSDGQLNKPLLASYLFSGHKQAEQVNAIIHPCVKQHFKNWVEQQSDSLFVAMESAILVESGFANEVDAIVMVYAPLELRVQRASLRDSAPREWIEKRVKSQMDDEDKKKQAHFIITNDGETPLIPQLIALLKRLETPAVS